ncbi:Glycoside hydrolase [Vigna unguiculata]|uniref:Glycoside hydrolase n=1 Tax=Vigna unguiculata TaxID=3917 RepID=A0A4D6L2M0_VIGUN|nr:Glycoside hydrolase [Vigna unguiculata]
MLASKRGGPCLYVLNLGKLGNTMDFPIDKNTLFVCSKLKRKSEWDWGGFACWFHSINPSLKPRSFDRAYLQMHHPYVYYNGL